MLATSQTETERGCAREGERGEGGREKEREERGEKGKILSDNFILSTVKKARASHIGKRLTDD